MRLHILIQRYTVNYRIHHLHSLSDCFFRRKLQKETEALIQVLHTDHSVLNCVLDPSVFPVVCILRPRAMSQDTENYFLRGLYPIGDLLPHIHLGHFQTTRDLARNGSDEP